METRMVVEPELAARAAEIQQRNPEEARRQMLERIAHTLTHRVINASLVSQGLLTNNDLPAWHPAPQNVRQTCSAAAAFCRQQGADIAKLAMQFFVANPAIHTTLVGTANPTNIEKNVR
jgi:aryl-alcohol dehydrogenase-like predicted oxidoreductase